MSSYTVNFKFTPEQLKDLENERIVIGRVSEEGSPVAVAWEAFHPLQSNIVKWEDDYVIYGSKTLCKAGQTITQDLHSSSPTPETKGYLVEPKGGIFLREGGYAVTNSYEEASSLTIGLAQAITVNGEPRYGAISAVDVPNGGTTVLKQPEATYVWVQAGIKSDTIISPISAITHRWTAVKIPPESEITLLYNSAEGTFEEEEKPEPVAGR